MFILSLAQRLAGIVQGREYAYLSGPDVISWGWEPSQKFERCVLSVLPSRILLTLYQTAEPSLRTLVTFAIAPCSPGTPRRDIA